MSAGETEARPERVDLSHVQPQAAVVLSIKTVTDLRIELNRVHLCLNSIGSFVGVASFVLRSQACDINADLAVVTDAAARKIEDARESLENAFKLLPARGVP